VEVTNPYTWGPRGPQRYFKLYDASPRHVVSEMVFSYLGHDVLRPVVFVGWFVRWLACVGVFVSMFVCSLTRFGVRISRKRLEIEARFQRTTNRKLHMGIDWSHDR